MSTIDGFKRIASDVANLCELQIQLFAVDGKVAASRAVSAVVAIAMAFVISLGAFTTLLLAGAWAIHEHYDLDLSLCLLICGMLGLLFAAALVVMGYRLATQASTALAESRSEFGANLRWIKSILASDGNSRSFNMQRTASEDYDSQHYDEANGFESRYTSSSTRS